MIIIGFVLSLLLNTVVCQRCNMVRRKEVREMSRDELDRYVNAIQRLNYKRSENSISEFDRFSKIHIDIASQVHGTPQFLPWHRIFIKEYERKLQMIDPEVTLPFWDWSIDYREPASSPILTDEGFGGNGDVEEDNVVNGGPFSYWSVRYPRPHYLRRDYTNGDSLPSFSSPKVIVNLLRNVKDFKEFSTRLELIHGNLHNSIGGKRGDLLPMHSPNDPLFYLHHAFVDLLWSEWQAIHPNSQQYSGSFRGNIARTSDILNPYNLNVQYAISQVNKCVVYSRYHGFDESFSASSVSGAKPSNPNPLPEEYLKMNNINVTLARLYEAQHRAIEQLT